MPETRRSRELRPLIAHRGASAHHPENTIAALRGAAEAGADIVELDVRITADGALAVHHDAQLGDGQPLTGREGQDQIPVSTSDPALAGRVLAR
jgi:glycerophosphoryl diester phosphodiesterase